jgi:hypothetical protein
MLNISNVLIISLIVFFNHAFVAAQRAAEPPVAPKIRIPVIRIDPARPGPPPSAALRRRENERMIGSPAPQPMPWRERIELFKRSGITLPPDPPPALHLSPLAAYVRDAGWIELYCIDECLAFRAQTPSRISPENYVSFSRRGFVNARLRLERGSRYTVDFNVRAISDSARFVVYVGELIHEFRTGAGPQTLSVVVDSVSAGYAQIALGSEQAFGFYSLDMMRVDDR